MSKASLSPHISRHLFLSVCLTWSEMELGNLSRAFSFIPPPPTPMFIYGGPCWGWGHRVWWHLYAPLFLFLSTFQPWAKFCQGRSINAWRMPLYLCLSVQVNVGFPLFRNRLTTEFPWCFSQYRQLATPEYYRSTKSYCVLLPECTRPPHQQFASGGTFYIRF